MLEFYAAPSHAPKIEANTETDQMENGKILDPWGVNPSTKQPSLWTL